MRGFAPSMIARVRTAPESPYEGVSEGSVAAAPNTAGAAAGDRGNAGDTGGGTAAFRACRVARALAADARRFLVVAAVRPAARRFRVVAAFFPAARRFRVVAALRAAALRFRVVAAFFAGCVAMGSQSNLLLNCVSTHGGRGLSRGTTSAPFARSGSLSVLTAHIPRPRAARVTESQHGTA